MKPAFDSSKSNPLPYFVNSGKGMIRTLKIVLILIWAWMVYVVIATSLESSLFEQWDYLGSIPWMRATLWDFYANILIIYLFVIWREKGWAIKFLWALLFFCLGSIATLAYLLIQLNTLSEGESLSNIFKPKSEST